MAGKAYLSPSSSRCTGCPSSVHTCRRVKAEGGWRVPRHASMRLPSCQACWPFIQRPPLLARTPRHAPNGYKRGLHKALTEASNKGDLSARHHLPGSRISLNRPSEYPSIPGHTSLRTWRNESLPPDTTCRCRASTASPNTMSPWPWQDLRGRSCGGPPAAAGGAPARDAAACVSNTFRGKRQPRPVMA